MSARALLPLFVHRLIPFVRRPILVHGFDTPQCFVADADGVRHWHRLVQCPTPDEQLTVWIFDVDVVREARLGVWVVGIVESPRRRRRVREWTRRELTQRIGDRDSPGVEEVRVPVEVRVQFVDGYLHHLRPAVIVEVEVRLQMGDLARCGLVVTGTESLQIGVDSDVEQRVEVCVALLGVIRVCRAEEYAGV